jgi:hypothetical protein
MAPAKRLDRLNGNWVISLLVAVFLAKKVIHSTQLHNYLITTYIAQIFSQQVFFFFFFRKWPFRISDTD